MLRYAVRTVSVALLGLSACGDPPACGPPPSTPSPPEHTIPLGSDTARWWLVHGMPMSVSDTFGRSAPIRCPQRIRNDWTNIGNDLPRVQTALAEKETDIKVWTLPGHIGAWLTVPQLNPLTIVLYDSSSSDKSAKLALGYSKLSVGAGVLNKSSNVRFLLATIVRRVDLTAGALQCACGDLGEGDDTVVRLYYGVVVYTETCRNAFGVNANFGVDGGLNVSGSLNKQNTNITSVIHGGVKENPSYSDADAIRDLNVDKPTIVAGKFTAQFTQYVVVAVDREKCSDLKQKQWTPKSPPEEN